MEKTFEYQNASILDFIKMLKQNKGRSGIIKENMRISQKFQMITLAEDSLFMLIKQFTRKNLYINLACLSVCLFVCLVVSNKRQNG